MFRKTLMALAAASLCSSTWAAVSAEEAKQLGNTLTSIGAEKAGNKDGTIPAYTGGLTRRPRIPQIRGARCTNNPNRNTASTPGEKKP